MNQTNWSTVCLTLTSLDYIVPNASLRAYFFPLPVRILSHDPSLKLSAWARRVARIGRTPLTQLLRADATDCPTLHVVIKSFCFVRLTPHN